MGSRHGPCAPSAVDEARFKLWLRDLVLADYADEMIIRI